MQKRDSIVNLQIIETVFYDSYGHLNPRLCSLVWLCILSCRIYVDEIASNNNKADSLKVATNGLMDYLNEWLLTEWPSGD